MPVQQINVKNSSEIESWEWGGGCGREAVRAGSDSSRTSCSNSSGDICRICHCESEAHNPLLAPCYCSVTSAAFICCSCVYKDTDIQLSYSRRRLCCAVLFHCVAALCVMWSLFVLIERAVEEVNRGLIAWPFWTKLVVVAVGFTGGAVFMYIQILLIQNAPEKMPISHGSPPVQRARTKRRERSARGQLLGCNSRLVYRLITLSGCLCLCLNGQGVQIQ
ncbi:hypothetical protein MSG28_007326 [Choristoneura fumiferana]|uniref:Uncharacterized protein n=1 Tax=Choristoneura fumiferana TaxID=7141 RepID=A0ACC0JWG5_CHOFU|nr:hypothetical protein MSG28_007326 [Choristoneura fumiferana]